MSLVEKTHSRREAGHSNGSTRPPSATRSTYTDLDDSPDENESIYNEICEMMDMGLTTKHEDAPKLPPKSALRTSGPTTHDVYLSSEEDASSAADDFSDYEDESGTDSLLSPRRRSGRSSYEKKARVVSVVFSGKPSLVELSPRRRTPSPFSTRSTYSNKSCSDRPPTPSSSVSSVRQESTKSLPATSMKNTPFLHIDPFANGSTYSLDMAPAAVEDLTPLRKTRTHSPLARGLARTFGLAKKRSRASLDPGLMLSQRRTSVHVSPEPSPRNEEAPVRVKSAIVSPPVTYESILEAAMGNSLLSMMNTPSRNMPLSPMVTTPTTEVHTAQPVPAKKSRLLSGLVRRRSSKLT